MPFTPLEFWTEHLRQTLQRYDTGLLRSVAGKLVKPRNQWPVEELIDRSLDAISNAAIIDRRLKVLEPAGRQLLALIGHSRQPRWRVGNLVEMLIALGHSDGLQPIRTALEAGLLYPDLLPGSSKVRSFEQWLGHSAGGAPAVFTHPHVTSRALGEDLGLPSLLTPHSSAVPHEADGLEWPLRLAVLWQEVSAAPLRQTQQGDLFKRDLERLTGNAILNSPLSEGLADLPDIGLLAVALGQLEGVLEASGNELRAVGLPNWQVGLAVAECLGSASRRPGRI